MQEIDATKENNICLWYIEYDLEINFLSLHTFCNQHLHMSDTFTMKYLRLGYYCFYCGQRKKIQYNNNYIIDT